jgi:hypothetical protein
MTPSKSLLFVISLALCLLGSGQAFAGKDDRCGEGLVLGDGGQTCGTESFFSRVAFGGGWTTKVKGVNTLDYTVSLSWVLKAQDGTGTLEALIDNNLRSTGIHAARGGDITLFPGESVVLTFYSGVNDPNEALAGTIVVGYKTKNPTSEILSLPEPTVQFNHEALGFQGTEFAYKPASVWRGSISATADGYENVGLSIGNPTKNYVTVQGIITNQFGAVLGTQTWIIPPFGANGFFINEKVGFGPNIFLPGKKLTGGAKLFSLDGVFIPLTMQFTGNAMSTGDIQPSQ